MTDTILVQSRKFKFVRRSIRNRDGGEAVFDIVIHPGAAVILPITDSGDIVLIRNYRHALKTQLWELPAGTLEEGEPAELCASRELHEETGFTAGELKPLIEFYPSPGFSTERMHGFLATGLKKGQMALEPDEQIEVHIFPLGTVRKMIADGQIIDGKTLLLLYHWLMRETPQ